MVSTFKKQNEYVLNSKWLFEWVKGKMAQSFPQPTIWKNKFTKMKYKGWNTLEGGNQSTFWFENLIISLE